MHYIYVIQHIKTLRIYIGQAKYPKTRWSGHKHMAKKCWLNKNYKNVQYIDRALAKHGISNFNFTIIDEYNTQTEANEAEEFWIAFFQSRNTIFGYNIIPGGKAVSGKDHPCYGLVPHNKLFTSEQEQEICDKYTNKLLSIGKLGKIYNCSSHCIFGILKRNNIKILGNAILSKGKHYSLKTEFKHSHVPINKLFSAEQEAEICNKYINDKLSSTQLAKEYECHRTVIIRLLERLNVDMRNRGFYSIGKSPPNKLFTEDQEQEICYLYQNEEITLTNIAEIYGCDRTVISDTLKKYDILVKSSGAFNKGKPKLNKRKFSSDTEYEICQKYIVEQLSAAKLGKIYNCDRTTISDLLKRNNIEIKNQGFYSKSKAV